MTAIASPVGTVGDIHVSQPLTDFSLGYHPVGFIAEQVFPVVPVVKENDAFYRWDKYQAARVERTDGLATVVADGAIASEEMYGTTLDTYNCQMRKRRARITDREVGNQDPALSLQQSRTRRAQDKVLLDMEMAVANILRTDASYAGDTTNIVTNSGGTQWNNSGFGSLGTAGTGHSLIVAQLQAGIAAIEKNTLGMVPNKIILPFAVAQILANDPGWADMFKYVSNLAQLQQDSALGLVPPRILGMEVLVPRAAYVTAVEGEKGSATDVWGKDVILLYSPDQPQKDDLTAGFIFRSSSFQVRVYREEAREATFYEPRVVQAEKAITFDAAYRIKAAIA